ncbi:MAG: DUF302 domain-containing protein [Bryobacteraceae bacterium]|jgi:uncharacterized protein (DUF302 family)
MLQVSCELGLEAIEAALKRAAQRREASVLTVTHVGQHLQEAGSAEDAFVFCLCQPELYAALMEGDIRATAFLPWRIAAYARGGQVTLEAMSPIDACRLLNRPDLAPLAAPLEDLLRAVMEEAARTPAASRAAAAAQHGGGLGATEEQMNVRGSIPQRIDCHGTKVEDLGGTGEHDAKGG